jgi:hypothetical protein
MASAAPDDPYPDELRPAVEHARAWLIARVEDLLDNEWGISPTLLPDVARFIATATEAVRNYERLVERLRP